MCLGIPGRILAIERMEGLGLAEGRVRFGAIERDVNLTFVPEAEVGDYVIVHVGFAISRIDEAEALATLEALRTLGELEAELGPGTATRPLGSGHIGPPVGEDP